MPLEGSVDFEVGDVILQAVLEVLLVHRPIMRIIYLYQFILVHHWGRYTLKHRSGFSALSNLGRLVNLPPRLVFQLALIAGWGAPLDLFGQF